METELEQIPLGNTWVPHPIFQVRLETAQIAKLIWPTWGPPGPVGPRWAPCWPHEPCYQGVHPLSLLSSPKWQIQRWLYVFIPVHTLPLSRYNKITTVYQGWLYVFLLVRMLPPQSAHFCSHDKFWTNFQIPLVFGWIIGPDLQITSLNFGRFLLWPQWGKLTLSCSPLRVHFELGEQKIGLGD